MSSRKDDRFRNLISGHLRTCTCTECVSRRLGPPSKPRQTPKTEHSDQDWQNFVDEISQVDVSNEPQYQRKQLHSVRQFPAEVRERHAKAIEEERQAATERERQAGTRPASKPTDPTIQQEEKRNARIEHERQAETRPSPKSTDPTIQSRKSQISWRLFILVGLFTVVVLVPVVLWTLGS